MVLNEYDSELIRPAVSGSLINSKAFTFEAWIAPCSYPWNWAPIIMQRDETAGFYFGIDGDGRLGLRVVVGPGHAPHGRKGMGAGAHRNVLAAETKRRCRHLRRHAGTLVQASGNAA